jgi:hypothetical protein
MTQLASEEDTLLPREPASTGFDKTVKAESNRQTKQQATKTIGEHLPLVTGGVNKMDQRNAGGQKEVGEGLNAPRPVAKFLNRNTHDGTLLNGVSP